MYSIPLKLTQTTRAPVEAIACRVLLQTDYSWQLDCIIERTRRTDRATMPGAVFAWVEVERPITIQVGIQKQPSETNARAVLWRHEEIVEADATQPGEHCRILEKHATLVYMVGKPVCLDAFSVLQPRPERPGCSHQDTVSGSIAAGREPVQFRLALGVSKRGD